MTGAASGIGRAVAERLAAQGARLALADINKAGLAAIAGSMGAPALPYDAAAPGSAGPMVRQAGEALGGLDAVINVAGVYARAHAGEMPRDQWARVLQINLSSAFEIAQASLPCLAKTQGALILTGSTAGLKGIAYASAYAAAKAGLVGLAKSLATEWAHLGVRVNLVAPGRVRTNIAAALPPLPDARPDLQRHAPRLPDFEEGAAPEEIAGLYAFLCSQDARFMTGEVLVADGGNMVG